MFKIKFKFYGTKHVCEINNLYLISKYKFNFHFSGESSKFKDIFRYCDISKTTYSGKLRYNYFNDIYISNILDGKILCRNNFKNYIFSGISCIVIELCKIYKNSITKNFMYLNGYFKKASIYVNNQCNCETIFMSDYTPDYDTKYDTKYDIWNDAVQWTNKRIIIDKNYKIREINFYKKIFVCCVIKIYENNKAEYSVVKA